jgi:hypothetical protein
MNLDKPLEIVIAEEECTASTKSTTILETVTLMNQWATANSISSNYYKTRKRRRLKLYLYAGRQRAYANLVNRIRSFWGGNAILFLGDWSDGNFMKGFMSTPGKQIRRILHKKFKVFMVDEFRTSLLHNQTLQPAEGKLRIIGRNNIPRQLHSVLTRYNEHTDLTHPGETQRTLCCFNRDRKAAINILNLGKSGREGLPRPAGFLRA